ncbi:MULTISPECIES: LPXTG cell wall anchor domain-containing protein [Enterococcaceae]|nr:MULTISPECIES: LPXTG cell wall anchor domain-containing protein [Enterococcaceae]MCI0130633.1 LPXTG cell wall anchor domain-containing protein [Vagococcus sp. CY53-2]RGI32341.1 LPXTG cell wall anchor domain-containing protein [Melissococcus sp. OM08-11BH]UNM90056.1 LPXTG cell wall anchor domain-containing protein [Vagococcus sp. CY52-2]
MLPQTGEVIMNWLPYIGIALVVVVAFLLFKKKKSNDDEEQNEP